MRNNGATCISISGRSQSTEARDQCEGSAIVVGVGRAKSGVRPSHRNRDARSEPLFLYSVTRQQI